MRGSEISSFTFDGTTPVAEERSGSIEATLGTTYNNDLAPASFSYAGGTETYAYDADGLLTQAGLFTIARRGDNGLPVGVSDGQFTLTRGFNLYAEVDSSVYSLGDSSYTYSLERDSTGRIASKAERSTDATHTWTYTDDSLGRLTTASRDGVLAESYAYDANGNRTAMRAPIRGIEATVSLTFGADDRIMTAADATYTFTADGFLASKDASQGLTTYEYSSLGELERVALPDGRDVTYAYDAFGRRVAKSVDGEVAERYLWAGATRLLAVYDGAGALVSRFTYADSRMPLSVTMGGPTYHLAFDQVGSLRAVFAEDGSIAREITYDSFGNVLADSNPSLRIPLGFAGGLADPDTGLTLFGARDYDPALGRWCAKDPIGFAGGDVNLYGYCVGDPLAFSDPTGLEIRLYSTDAWNLDRGLNHAAVYSTELHDWEQTSASWLDLYQSPPLIHSRGKDPSIQGGPYVVVPLDGMSETEFMRRMHNYPLWDYGLWVPWKNDCHSAMEGAFEYAGVPYPGAPFGRIDHDDVIMYKMFMIGAK